MYFGTKSYLKSTRNHTAKHALSVASSIMYFVINVLLLHKRGVLLLTKNSGFTDCYFSSNEKFEMI
jgi:hypothetical protein